MKRLETSVKVTGMGVVTPIGIGLSQFTSGLKKGTTNFSRMEFNHSRSSFSFPVAKVNDFNLSGLIGEINVNERIIEKTKRLRNISASTSFGVYSALEAWADAGLTDANIDLTRVAIVSGGTNTQQASLKEIQDKYREKLQFMNPNYGFNFFDTDLVGVLSELFGIRGEGHVIGAASASGNMAIIQGARLIKSNEYDLIIVVAPLMELSIYEFQGFTSMGAMAVISEGMDPSEICRPFDEAHCGFVNGQSAGCMILESEEHAAKRGKNAYGSIAGYGLNMDANRNPNPSIEGEEKAMRSAMINAGVNFQEIDYVNTHGTASKIGDKTEIEALLSIGLEGVKANSTKSLIGHALSAAGVVESIASLLQMKYNFLHPNNNLINPINDKIYWIKEESKSMVLNYTMSNNFGFGGINTSIIFKKN
ncbi:beta-ketoacyl synthase N-terminal-like domain-containing protein [Flavobacterium sp. H122]|uniref:beta-ketoacyl synthase N-terminal-like domain-containing protein n=1 Tax=Flavobacterium sp. H122 TaxID=2529860 RepID=UPI0010AA4464|nr:beta-ketoacyl synthase N-terminal-like domain-containing protein [Flavobacterium sp. H122]